MRLYDLFAIAGLMGVGACSTAEPSDSPPQPGPSELAAVAALSCSNCGAPLPGLTAEQLTKFTVGQEDFAEEEEVDEGLGPVFNGDGCGSCHGTPAIGGTSTVIETRFGRVDANGVFDPLERLGGELRQDRGIGELGFCGLPAEVTPSIANVVGLRRTTSLFGLGLVDAVPDAALVLLAASQPAATRGMVNWLTDLASGKQRVGRFGWKNQVATLRTFSGDAYVNEMGITNPIFPDEVCPQGDCSKLTACDTVADPEDDGSAIENFTNFMTLLAPPQRGPTTFTTFLGELAFISVGCADCHTPVQFTGPSPVAALHFVAFQPYSDFLLHDMGALGDGITQGGATGRFMRTAPLWGVSSQPLLLHDGRTSSLDAAIRAHDGQGKAARDRYAALSSLQRSTIIAFLRSL
jgi:CxxC motif-containing protein (DUF1111 family)